MEHFVILANFTKQGVEKIKESPTRLEGAKKAFAAYGAEMKHFFLTTGQYDMVVIVEAPDTAAVAKAVLAITSAGSVRSETLRAFTEAEYQEIIDALP
jgi:uncharacterized protein with GYD domain